jgi:hypothetical protein
MLAPWMLTPLILTPCILYQVSSHRACSTIHAHSVYALRCMLSGACSHRCMLTLCKLSTSMGHCACLRCTSLHHASSDWAGSTGMPTPFLLNCACSHCACLHLACSHRPCSYPCPRYECSPSACPRHAYYTCQVYSQVVSPCSIICASKFNNLDHYVQLTVCATIWTCLCSLFNFFVAKRNCLYHMTNYVFLCAAVCATFCATKLNCQCTMTRLCHKVKEDSEGVCIFASDCATMFSYLC